MQSYIWKPRLCLNLDLVPTPSNQPPPTEENTKTEISIPLIIYYTLVICSLICSDPYLQGQWIYWNGHYYSHREKSAAYSWYTAEGVCREHGDTVHLASIHNQQENDFIRSLSSDEQWIGITDDSTRSNSFRWIDRSPDGDFTHWADGEPNHSTIDEDCGAMKPDGTWMDVACIKQRLTGVTRFDRRAFTCKTSGKNIWTLLYLNNL